MVVGIIRPDVSRAAENFWRPFDFGKETAKTFASERIALRHLLLQLCFRTQHLIHVRRFS